jgi:hypothetical protein
VKKVEHSTRLVSCATEQGIVHIARHIGADMVLLDQENSWAVEQVKGKVIRRKVLIVGWTGRVVCIEPNGLQTQIQDNVVRTSWPETMTFEQLLSLGSQL